MSPVPPYVWAWLLVFAFFGAMKLITWHRTTAPAASLRLQLGYLFAWPGLDAPAFLRGNEAGHVPVDPREAGLALGKVFLGAALFWGAARIVPGDRPFVQAWVGLAGLAVGLLGGAFHFLSRLWRAGGVEAEPVMNAPLRSANLADFWGRRWNTSFQAFVRRFIHRPLAMRFGNLTATLGVFVYSGLLHDAVLSLPAGAGYGRPTLYFLIQFVGLVAERSRVGRRLALGGGLRGRVFAAATIVGPVGLLFHRPFVERVWLPFMHAAGAI